MKRLSMGLILRNSRSSRRVTRGALPRLRGPPGSDDLLLLRYPFDYMLPSSLAKYLGQAEARPYRPYDLIPLMVTPSITSFWANKKIRITGKTAMLIAAITTDRFPEAM